MLRNDERADAEAARREELEPVECGYCGGWKNAENGDVFTLAEPCDCPEDDDYPFSDYSDRMAERRAMGLCNF